jgi:hypothetical protein
MQSCVCNCKVKYIRPQYKDLKECLEDENNVYIGRKGIIFIDGKRYPSHNSIWANPYKVGKDGNLQDIINKYDKYIKEKIINENLDITELKDKNLYCWCVNNITRDCNDINNFVCHGQVLLKLLHEKL